MNARTARQIDEGFGAAAREELVERVAGVEAEAADAVCVIPRAAGGTVPRELRAEELPAEWPTMRATLPRDVQAEVDAYAEQRARVYALERAVEGVRAKRERAQATAEALGALSAGRIEAALVRKGSETWAELEKTNGLVEQLVEAIARKPEIVERIRRDRKRGVAEEEDVVRAHLFGGEGMEGEGEGEGRKRVKVRRE